MKYRVALFLDSDKDPDDSTILSELEKLEVKILRWEKGKATEDVLFQDIGDKGLKKLLDLLAAEEDLGNIPEQINSKAGKKLVGSWDELKEKCTDKTIRTYLATCAKDKNLQWIKKRLTLSESIGLNVFGPNLSKLKGANAKCMQGLRDWIDSE